MARRKAYTKVFKENQVRAEHVKGMGDKLFRGFQCLNSECKEFIFELDSELQDDFDFECPHCQFHFQSGSETPFYDYNLKNIDTEEIVETGTFAIPHEEYLEEAAHYKYCIICNTMKPIQAFDIHSSRKSGRQGECRLCKGIYNNIKNQTRTTDQHREASQKRRLYMDLAGGAKINSRKIHARFEDKCFKCGKDLKGLTAKERPLDHTLPVYYLWALNTNNATLLCREHNGEKSGKWPSDYYSEKELKRLSILTGIDFQLLNGKPQYNPEALKKLQDPYFVDSMLTKFSAYMDEVTKLRNRIKNDTGIDFFKYSKILSPTHLKKADVNYYNTYGNRLF